MVVEKTVIKIHFRHILEVISTVVVIDKTRNLDLVIENLWEIRISDVLSVFKVSNKVENVIVIDSTKKDFRVVNNFKKIENI